MTKPGDLLTRYRNLFLLLLLGGTFVISRITQEGRAPATVEIPVVQTSAQAVDALTAFHQQRDADVRSDIAALEHLCAQEDGPLREEAAAQLQALIDSRQAQTALEGALTGSSLYPCVAVVTGKTVTIVTEKNALTEKDTALVLTLAAAHVGASPENVRILTAE